MDIDWNAPLEAYHPDGRVLTVDLPKDCVQPDRDGDYVIDVRYESNKRYWFHRDGTHRYGADWRIRNRTVAPDHGDIAPATIDRMVRLVREFAGADYSQNCGPIWTECRALTSLLPPEPLAQRAREICAAEGLAVVGDGPTMRAVMAALRDRP